MADIKQKAAASFEDMLKAGRKKKENERLAQKMLGTRRSSTPSNASKKTNLGGSLASRVGITKRPASLSRSQSSQARLAQPKPDPAPRQPRNVPASRPPRNNAQPKAAAPAQSNGASFNFKGAAGGPYTVVASNFAQGTTAADIQSVMVGVGGPVLYCKLIATTPSVIAEMAFKDRSGADAVIETFNNKKADGAVLYVHMKDADAQPEEQPAAEPAQPQEQDVDMDVDQDETAQSREAQNKLREERRGGRDTRGRQDAFPSGPRNMRQFEQEDDYYYNRGPPQGAYQDQRYGFGGGYGGRGQYQDRRSYGRGGQWR